MRKLLAMVIGNSAYQHSGALKNPIHDAEDLTAKLVECGFTVGTLTDSTHKEMDTELTNFGESLEGQDVGLFFFAGHGVQVGGENYLMAVDTAVDSATNAKFSALSLDKVIETMKVSGVKISIVILDACRNNPWERRWRRAGPEGLATVFAPKGTLIAYSTSPGEVADDGEGRNGAYTAALLEHIDTPELPIEMMFKRVRNSLAATTEEQQTSWEHTSLSGEFYFKLSIGSLVKTYDPPALADKLYVPNAKLSGEIIRGLKSHNWPTQNAAIAKFDPEAMNKALLNALFVMGRNIYQAACGSAHAAQGFIAAFMDRTLGMDKRTRKALLDGMLFEIFFGPDGELRQNPKTRYFNEVFELQAYPNLATSFAFIAECLAPVAERYYTIPGSGHERAITVTVEGQDDEEEEIITAVYVDSQNVLQEADDMAVRRNWNDSYSLDELAEELADQMLVPKRLLKIKITPRDDERRRVSLPRGYSVRKPA